jgi:uncharacterized membrane protein YtjA (UPF0391 family)
MDKTPAKVMDFATFSLIALVAMLFGFGDNSRAAIIVDHLVFYVASISAGAALVIKRPREPRRRHGT